MKLYTKLSLYIFFINDNDFIIHKSNISIKTFTYTDLGYRYVLRKVYLSENDG